ncbi:MAG: imidazolonepropionase [Bdellovibrionales bacterium]|nr:imidazolonepropionase [Bdellovibrionales bacterium]
MGKVTFYKDISELLTLQGVLCKQGRHPKEEDLGEIKKAALLVKKGKVFWIGSMTQTRSKKFSDLLKNENVKEVSLKDHTVLPGFIECHTHTLFSGDRTAEFELRNQGISYQEIAEKGGGILSTMRSTRKESSSRLLETGQNRVNRFIQQGVTTLEIKSGYALNKTGEIKMLKVARDLKGLDVVSTFLGAHSIPPEFQTSDEYLRFLATEVLPYVAKEKLAERVDIFIEKGYFSVDQARKFIMHAYHLGLRSTIHADQLTNNHGGVLGSELGSDSVDHLVQLNSKEIKELARANISCVLLPAADLYLKMAYPKARDLIEEGARIALATDFNPGSSPTQSLSLVGVLARLEMRMTLPEVISAYTVGAAYALHRHYQCGALYSGSRADFSVLDESWRNLFYEVGRHPVKKVFFKGRSAKL